MKVRVTRGCRVWHVHCGWLGIVVVAWLCVSRVDAQGAAGAAKAFAQAQAAELAGNPEEAARFYELAYMLAPTPEALRSAARTRLDAGHRALAASHADVLLRQHASDPKSRAIAQSIMEATQGHLLSVIVRCSAPCQIEVDGGVTPSAPSTERVLYLEPGGHEVTAVFDGQASPAQYVSGGAGMRLTRSFEPPPPPPSTAQSEPEDVQPAAPDPQPSVTSAPQERGISRLWFIASATAAAGLGAVTVWSGLDVLDKHDAYEKSPTKGAYDEGVKLERRTNILIGASAAAVASAVVLALFTDWSGDEDEAERDPNEPSVNVGFLPSGTSLAITKRF